MSINLSLLNQPLFGEGLEEDSSYQKSFQNGVDNRISLDGDYPFLFTENLSEEMLKEDWKEIYEHLSREEKRNAWRILIEEVTIHPDRSISYTLNI